MNAKTCVEETVSCCVVQVIQKEARARGEV